MFSSQGEDVGSGSVGDRTAGLVTGRAGVLKMVAAHPAGVTAGSNRLGCHGHTTRTQPSALTSLIGRDRLAEHGLTLDPAVQAEPAVAALVVLRAGVEDGQPSGRVGLVGDGRGIDRPGGIRRVQRVVTGTDTRSRAIAPSSHARYCRSWIPLR